MGAMAPEPTLPPHDQLADEDDELGWDRDEHGRMADYATGDEAVQTRRDYEGASFETLSAWIDEKGQG